MPKNKTIRYLTTVTIVPGLIYYFIDSNRRKRALKSANKHWESVKQMMPQNAS